MTRFQKVTSALLGERTADRDEAVATSPDAVTTDPAAARQGRPTRQADPDTVATRQASTGTVATEQASTGTVATEQASPDTMDHAATEPDMFGSTTRPDNGSTPAPYPEGQPGAAPAPYPEGQPGAAPVPYPEGQPGAATIAAVPADEATGTAGRHAAAPAAEQARPGALGDFSDLTYGNLIPDAQQYTAQWQQVQFRFVEDPQASVTEAADIVAQVTAEMEAAIQQRQRAIQERQRAIAEQQRRLRGRWGEGANADTEALRETLQMYKTFLDQLIGSRAG
jgi:hypothetical protein